MTAYATFAGLSISEKGPDGKRYWHLTWDCGAFNDTDISVGRVNGIGTGAASPLKEYVRKGGRCVITDMCLYSNTDATGVSAFAMYELSGLQNQLPYAVGPKFTFVTNPDGFSWQCNWPVPVEKDCRIRIYPVDYAATTTLTLHMEGWLDG